MSSTTPDGRCLGSAQLDESARSVGDEVQEQLAFELRVRGERSPIGFREAGVPVLVCGHAVTIERLTALDYCRWPSTWSRTNVWS